MKPPPMPTPMWARDYHDEAEVYVADDIYARDAQWAALLDAAAAQERERCAVAAWSAGMDAHNKVNGRPTDARNVGATCAAAIRALKDS